MGRPEVSVIMPAYQHAAYIERAVESVLAQKAEVELIIIDDASRDRTEEAVRRYLPDKRVRYCRNERNLGPAGSRNRGIAMAEGRYLAFLDADDWWEPDKLEKQLALMREGCVLSYTGRRLYAEEGSRCRKVIAAPETLSFRELLRTNPIACSSVLVRREAFDSFRWEHDELHEDYLLWLKLLQRYGQARGLAEPLLCSRLTGNGKSRKKWRTVRMTYGVYRQIGTGRVRAWWYVGNHLVRSLGRYVL